MYRAPDPVVNLEAYQKPYLSPKQLADYIGIARRTIYYQIAKGALPTIKVGHLTLIRTEDARRFLQT